jgi:hypothetical protein
MKVMWLLYDATYALTDIHCGPPEAVDHEVAKTLVTGEVYIAIRLSCEAGRQKAEVYRASNGEVVKEVELDVDGRELIYSSIATCTEHKQSLEILLRDAYRGGVPVSEREREAIKTLSEFLKCSQR